MSKAYIRNMPSTKERKICLVTGASRGIGYELVKRLSKESNCIVYAFSRNEDALKRLQSSNKNIRYFAGDLVNKEDRNKITQIIKEEEGRLDLLFNNAGLLFNKDINLIKDDEIDLTFQVNIISVIKFIQALLPLLSKSDESHIVNISSMGGFQGSQKFKGLSVYSASKAALNILSEALAEELSEENICVNALNLGAVQTEMLATAFPGYAAPFGPEQMAEYIASFGLEAHKYINGKVLPISIGNP